MHVVENKAFRRYKVLSYDPKTNFCKAVPYQDDVPAGILEKKSEFMDEFVEEEGSEAENDEEVDALVAQTKQMEELMSSEIHDLKNTWFVFNKKMNTSLSVMPAEMMNTYDMIAKTLPVPTFELYRYASSKSLYDILNEITSKMAHYYFSIYQALFSNDQDDLKRQQALFLSSNDPVDRAKKVVFLFSEFIEMLDKKMYYVQKTAEEFKDRNKKTILEGAL